MDGPRRVTFRIEHNCTLAKLSREVGELHVWTGRRLEIVLSPAGSEEAVARRLDPLYTWTLPDAVLSVWRPAVEPGSISNILERHGQMWIQPLRLLDGWEHYEVIAFGDEQGALDELRADHVTQVAKRVPIAPEDVTTVLFQSILPALEAPTEKQAEALLKAFGDGYYQSPRKTTTEQVAGTMGIGRSAFEERLRNGENRVMAAIAPALAVYRQR